MPLLAQFNDKTKLTIVRKATETLSNLCARHPQLEQVKSAILPLAHLIQTDDEEGLKHACWALFRLTCGEMDIRQAVIDAGVFPRLVELLLSPSHRVLLPALSVVDNIIPYVNVVQIQVEKGDLVNDAKNALLHPSWFGNIHFANAVLLLLLLNKH
ncbi:unnamed protein product [Fraxinus pennsylvanica]|uniref:Uncharacterized protein n=1 Tax=Fraxinus pennsylvanica TaxID=56036 RepID=A0AAD2E8G7_9LAMI|nr:unnamed protein product [Fraxinus pennsylvanica]